MEQTPMICSKILVIEILIERINNGKGMSIPRLCKVQIGYDQSVLYTERVEDPTRSREDNDLGYGIFHNWKEFKAMDTVEFHPAQMIEDWAASEKISLKWIGAGI